MPFLATKAARLHYAIWGEEGGSTRPWVTLVNGHTRSLRDFKAMGNFLVERGWRVLALDNRGSGETLHERPFTIDDLADDIAALWRAVGCERSHLLGISMGGMIALTLAARRPQALTSLVLVSTASAWNEPIEDYASKDVGVLESEMLRYFSPSFVERQKPLIQSMIRDLSRAFGDEARAHGTRAQRAAFQGYDAGDRLASIGVPTLVLHGAEDRVVPLQRGKDLVAAISGARLEIFHGVGHLLLAESAQRLYVVVGDFFKSVELKTADIR